MVILFRCTLLIVFLVVGGLEATAGSKKTATITGINDRTKGFGRMLSVFPRRMDGKTIGVLSLGPNIKVPPGRHSFLVSVKLSTGFMRAIYTGNATIKANLRAGRKYQSVGRSKDNTVQVWIKDIKSGKRVSNIVSAKMQNCPIILKVCH